MDQHRQHSCCAKQGGHTEQHAHDHHGAATQASTGKPGAIYTCPMHPQIRQSGPGFCPICGMALEPVTATLDGAPNPELRDMTRRFWIGLALTAPVIALGMLAEMLGLDRFIPPSANAWIQ